MASWVVRTACSHGESYLSAKSLHSLLVSWVPLSQMISSGVSSTEKQKLRAEITSLEGSSNQQSKGSICYLEQICPYLILSKVNLVPQ